MINMYVHIVQRLSKIIVVYLDMSIKITMKYIHVKV